jgi:large repetitive protein
MRCSRVMQYALIARHSLYPDRMSQIRNVSLCVLLLTAALLAPIPAFAGDTVFTNTDNQNNAGTGVPDGDMDRLVGNTDPDHPIEFTINVTTLPTTSAVLTLRAFDVDEEQGEVDEVYLNGVLLGPLTGANGVFNATAFNINPNLVVAGTNTVTVMVDTSGDVTQWVTNVEWAQLLIDGGSNADGNTGAVRITGYSVAAGTVTINTQSTVHSTTGGDYRLEVSIVAPNGQTSSVLSQDFTATAGQDLTINLSPTYALNGVTGTYTVQAQLFFIVGGFPLQQDIDTTQFVHTQNVGVTDADMDGLTDSQEQTLGTSRFNPDTDGDGVNDPTEVGNVASPTDTDGDGVINALESTLVDTDNDGVNNQLDPANTNPCVPNANGATCLAADTDGDGLTNAQEDALGTSRSNPDSDGDGTNDGTEVGNVAAPTDTDGDGIINALESTAVDTDGDGVNNQLDPANTNPCSPNASNAACLAVDSDGDGLTNGQEDTLGTDRSNPDTDGDGANDGTEVGGNVGAPIDTDGDGVPNVFESGTDDADGDGIANSSDPDADNDGIPDSVERGPTLGVLPDTDGDSVPNYLDPDSDGDGVPDAIEAGPNPASPSDSDGDNQPDYLDTDSDNDGISDTVESDATGTDTDGDDIDDAFDVDTTGGTDADDDGVDDAAVLPDTDGDGTADLRDLDSDGDGLTDSAEGAVDTDSDGAPDFRDLDSDNDAVLDVEEAGLVDADDDGLVNAGQTPVSIPPDTDGDNVPDFQDLDSNGDGTPDIVTGGFGPLDGNGDGRIDTAADTDGDGIANVRDGAPLVPGNAGDSDNDGVPDSADLDLDDDGIPNSADGGDDADGDGRPNFADLDSDNDGISDIIEAGGTDANGDGRVDNFADSNHNGLADSVESALGGTAFPLPDTDGDGATNHRDVDSDGDGMNDLVESGGTDGNGDGRVDSSTDANHDGLADALETSMVGGHSVRPVDTDGDGIPDYLDGDSDADGIADSREGGGDADADGIADFRDSPGKLETAVRGTGALSLEWVLLLLGIVVIRLGWKSRLVARKVPTRNSPMIAVLLACASVAATLPERAHAADAEEGEGFYVGLDIGQSWLKPRDNGGGYAVSDETSFAWRALAGYRFSPRWSAEVWFVDAGEAGISSDNPAVGELGAIEYKLLGLGAEWMPFGGGAERTLFPTLKAGVIQTSNSANGPLINYERQHHTGIYFGAGGGWQLTRTWAAQAELMSYDRDELVLSVGVRASF